MENFDWTKLERKIAVKSTVAKIYDAWTKVSELERWFLKEATYFDSDDQAIGKDIPIQEGNTYEWTWFLYEAVEKGHVISTNGVDNIQFTFAKGCHVEVNLIQKGEYTVVIISQKNIPTDDKSKIDIRLGCDSGWAFFLVNLKSIYEGGIDLRNKDLDLSTMTNN